MVRAVHLGFEHQALGVHQEVALPSLDLLSSVVASPFSAHAGRLDRLGIHHAGAGLRISVHAHPHTLA
jgi:hypothetical protein